MPCFTGAVLGRFKLTLAILTAGLLIGANSSSWAATSIGAQFIGRNTTALADILAPSETAGVVPQANWNPIDSGGTFKGTSISLLDSAANFTSVKIKYDADDSWNSDGGTATPDQKLMKGEIKANNPNAFDRVLLIVTNVPAGTYNVLVYGTVDGVGAQLAVNVGTQTNFIAEENIFSSYILATSTTPGNYVDANYAEFDGVSPAGSAIIIVASKNYPQTNTSIGVSAVQLIQVSGSAYGANTDPCSITADPSSTLSVAGGTASFSVGVGGPGPSKILWTKNGTIIPGATSANYTTPPTVYPADNGALFRAVVYNNVNTNTSGAATLTVDPNTPPSLTQGFLTVEQWQNIGAAVGANGVADLKTNIPGSGNVGGPPTTTYYVGGANVPQPTPNLLNFGDYVWGWLKPDVTADYDFFIRNDDAGEFYINPTPAVSGTNTLPDVQVDLSVCAQYTCCLAFLEPPDPSATASPIHLVAGNLYGIVMLLKQAGGGDFMQLAWRQTTDPTPAASLSPIPPANVYTMATPAGQRATITQQPAPATILQGRKATFTIAVTTTPGAGSYSLQWLRNGTAISGATSTSYTTPAAAWPADNGTVYSVRVLTLVGVLNSSNATLTVNQDIYPPVASIGSITRNDGVIEVGVSFDEPINPSTLVAGNFSVTGAASTTFNLATNSYGDYQGVVLDTTGLTAGGTYTAQVKNVADVYGNVMAQTSTTFTVGPVKWAESGIPARPGQVVPASATGFDILNGGREEWGTYDEVTMAYVKKTNDFDVQVQVVYAEPGSEWSRVGLQARNGLDVGEDPNDRNIATGTVHAYAQTHVNPNQTIGSSGRYDPSGGIPSNPTPNNGHEQNERLAAAGTTVGWGSPATPPVYPNVWLRLQRRGTNINGFRSTDGVNWTSQGSTSLTDQQPDMYVGMSLSSETGNIWATATYDVWNAPFDPIYARLFVAQYRNFTDVPALSIALVAGRPTVTFTGILQSSATVNGTYSDVVGATSPYTVPLGQAASFYKIRGGISSQ